MKFNLQIFYLNHNKLELEIRRKNQCEHGSSAENQELI